jgi:hypothetical protein
VRGYSTPPTAGGSAGTDGIGGLRSLGVCDSDCQDLDLRAHWPGGNQVLAEDVNTDDVPILTFVAPSDGPHPITVVMSDCRTELCYFGVRVLAR